MTKNALIVVEKLDVAVVFSDGGMDKLLKEVESKAMAHVPDLSTDQGRKDIASMAHKVARSKTLLDDLGKEAVADWTAKTKRVNGIRKTARDFLDGLKDRVRKPLTDWDVEQAKIKAEEDEKERLIIQGRVDALAEYGVVRPFFEIAAMTEEEASAVILSAKSDFEAEKKRFADEEADRKAEDARLKKVKEEQEAEAARLKAANDKIIADQKEAQDKIDEANRKIEADRKALEDEKKAEADRKEREAFEKKATERAIEEARIAAEEVETAKILQEALGKAEAERQAALKPDKEKLIAWVGWFLDVGNLPIRPKLQTEEAQTILYDALLAMDSWLRDIRNRAEEI